MGLSSRTYMNQQNIKGPVAILWDIENCSVPSDVCPEDVAGNIRMALRVHPIIQDAAITLFSAYGDFSAFPKRLREGCQRTGVKLVDVPNGRKDAADKAILVDMFLFALDNPPPSTILLITGDVDFSPALHILGQRGYTVILVIPAAMGVSSALTKAGRFVWDWPSVARGDGFVPPKTQISRGSSQVAGYVRGFQINENPDTQNDEETIMDRGIATRNEYAAQTNINQRNSQNHHSRSRSPPSGLNDVPGMPANEEDHPGYINGLKGQLVKLLELSGGCLPLVRVPAEYSKSFGRDLPFGVAEYGVSKLVNLLNKMVDIMTVEGEGEKKYVYLSNAGERHEKVENSNQLVVFPQKDERGKGCEKKTVDTNGCTTKNDEEASSYSGNLQPGIIDVPTMPANEEKSTAWVQLQHRDIINLKGQLVKLLELSEGCLPLGRVHGDYHKIFGQQLCMAEYGVSKLVNLLMKMSDIMTVEGEGNKKYVYLRKANDRHEKVENSNQSTVFPEKDKSKGCEEETVDTSVCTSQNDEADSYSRNPQSGLSNVLTMPANKEEAPGDIISLKGQLVKLLELSEGCLPLVRVPGDYHKIFGQQLCMAEYGVNKLVNLLKKMSDTMTVEGEGEKKCVYLRKGNEVENSNQSTVFPEKDERGNGCEKENVDASVCTAQSDEADSYSRNPQSGLSDVLVMPANKEVAPGDMISLKGQLVKLLELSGGCLTLFRICGEYNKIFGQQLCMAEYGENKLVNLLKKMTDTMTVEGEGQEKHVYLRSANDRLEKVDDSNQLAIFPKIDERSKGCPKETVDIKVCTIPECSSDEFSDDNKSHGWTK
ncbi:hypothetical protein C5167_023705 [Papaver somniferum]|uniref:HTH OST-type domain-containing protein n=1 Tax=Papaver somniferum TaxID=3469 RepID=A0A4Y7JMI6_PAPSO|nr:uncharacterized protein LOC113282723 [Papaver somniferum]XP_026387568.1 uncharacterized protein LOC113282723 [Papaver somniferum]XP_026387569.1 uncharacterized protein LOC113282723 [Papaver somniferum]XP_026387570.1 uncharacterized protein LOC113282723 [Papaver somniferum]RZC61947.1 hypothetical protein C5167_023705 [Papaver somniferum]